MAPPCKTRRVSPPGTVRLFRPEGGSEAPPRTLRLRLDGLEALRLVELLGLDQTAAAARMGISRQTFGRVLAGARRVVAQAVVGGFALRIADDEAVCAPAAPPATARPVAVSAEAASLEAAVAPRFGRAPGFLLVDPVSFACEYLPHESTSPQGRGTDAVARLARAGVAAVLTGFLGPRAAEALAAAGIPAFEGLGALSVREAVERYARGALSPSLSSERTSP